MLDGRVPYSLRAASHIFGYCSPSNQANEGEILYLQLAISLVIVSLVLTREGGTQKPVYYTSKLLKDMKAHYPKMEKITYVLPISAQWLWPYFQVHSITVLTDQPPRLVLQKFDTFRRITKWVVDLGEFDIHYYPWPFIKTQELVDFLMECMLPKVVEEEIEVQHQS